MSAGGGAGRRLPVIVELILQGQQQAIAGIRAVGDAYRQAGSAANSAVGPFNKTQQVMATTAKQTTLMDSGFKQINRSVGATGPIFNTMGGSIGQASRQMTLFETGARKSLGSIGQFTGVVGKTNTVLASTGTGMRTTAAGFQQVASAATKTSDAVQNSGQRMSRMGAAMGALREESRGLAFAAIGMFGAINEAVFMMQNATNSSEKLADAQAKVTQLENDGQKGTTDYTRAVQALDKAQRANTFTTRIMTQSIFDIVSFSALASAQFGGLIASYRKHRGEAIADTAANIANAASNVEVAASNVAVTGSLAATRTAYSGAISSVEGMTAASSVAVVKNEATAASMVATAVAAAASVRALGGYSGALRNAGTFSNEFNAANKGLKLGITDVIASMLGLGGVLDLIRNRGSATGGIMQKLSAIGAKFGGVLAKLAPIGVALRGVLGGMGSAIGGMSTAMTTASSAVSIFTGLLLGAAIGTKLQEQNFLGLQTANDSLARSIDSIIPGFYEWSRSVDEMDNSAQQTFGDMNKNIPILGDWLFLLGKAGDATKEADDGLVHLANGTTMAREDFQEFTDALQKWRDEMSLGTQSAEQMTGVMTQAVTQAFDVQPVENFLHKGIEPMIAGIDSLNKHGLIDPTRATEMRTSLTLAQTSLQEFGKVVNDPSIWDLPIDQFFTQIQHLDDVTANMPGIVDTNVTPFVDAFTTEFQRLIDEGQLTADDIKRIMESINTGIIPQDIQQRFPELSNGIQSVRIALTQLGLPADEIQQVMQELYGTMADGGQVVLAGIPPLKQSEQTLTDYAESVKKAAEEVNVHTVVTNENVAAVAAEVIARQHQIDIMTAVSDAMNGLNAQSITAAEINVAIIRGISQTGQAFNESAVGIAAATEGFQTWRDTLAQAYSSIVQNATALGYMGDISSASAQSMLEFTAAQTKVNEANTQGVDIFFQLGDAAKQQLATMNIYGSTLAQVALGHKDLTDEQSIAIQVAGQWDESLKRNIDGMAELMSNGFSLQQVMAMDNVAIEAQLGLLKNSETGYKATAEEAAKWAEEMSKLNPALQTIAQSMNILNIQGQKMQPWMQRTADYLAELDKGFVSGEDEARKFAIAQGVDVVTAMKATGPALSDIIIGLGDLKDTELSVAEAAQESSQKFADAWMESFDEIKAGQDEFGGNMASAMGKMGQEFGDEMEVGLSDIKKKVSKGTQALGEQFAEEIFPEDFLATAIIEGNDPGDIVKELKDFMHDVVDEDLITKAESKKMFNPLMDFMKHDLPSDTDQAMGYLIGRMPHLMDAMKPVIVNGIEVAGGEARAALKTSLVDPFIEGLKGLETGMSGVDFGRNLVTMVGNIMPQLETEFPKIAGLMQQTLDDTNLTTDQKVQELMGYLEQISPAFAAQIMAIDSDGDKIADIMDDKILGPMKQMQLGLMEADRARYQVMANVNKDLGNMVEADYFQRLADGETAAINEIMNGMGKVTPEVYAMGDAIDATGKKVDSALAPTKEWTDAWEKMDPITRATSINLWEAATGLDAVADGIETSAVAWNNMSLDDQIDAINGVTGSTDTATGALDNMAGSADTATKSWDDMSLQERINNLNGVATAANTAAGALHAVGTTQAGAGVSGDVTAEGNIPGSVPTPVFTDAEAAWTAYTTFVNEQVNAIGVHLLRLATGYGLTVTGIQTAITLMETAWSTHATNVGAQVDLTGQNLTRLVTGYGLVLLGVQTALTQMTTLWTGHATAINDVYNTMIMPAINTYSLALVGMAVNSFVNTQAASQNWVNHGTAVQTVITSTLASALSTYGVYLSGAANNVQLATNSMTASWQDMESKCSAAMQALAINIENAMGKIGRAMNGAAKKAIYLKAQIDALQSKDITITTHYRTVGAPGGTTGNMQSAQHGFQGIVRQPTRFVVGERNQPEFVSVTPLLGKNAEGDDNVRKYFDSLRTDSMKQRPLERAGEGGLGSSVALSPAVESRGPANSGLKRPDIRTGDDRKKRTLNSFFEDVLTYGEEQEYEKLLKKLKKKHWKPSKLNDKDEDRLYEIEDKILKAREDQINSIKSAMEQVQRQINLTTDLTSEDELEKWVSTVIPPLSTAPLSMDASSVKAMSMRGRYEHHRDAMKAGRRDQLNWMSQEYDRQIQLTKDLEEKRVKEEEEKDAWIEEHGSKKQKKALKKKREKQKKEQRKKLDLARGARRDFAYGYSLDRYYSELVKQVDPPVTIPLSDDASGIDIPKDSSMLTTTTGGGGLTAKRGFHGTVEGRTNITAGEFGKKERIDITPRGEETHNIAKEVREEIRHFVTGQLIGLGAGDSNKNREVIMVNINQPLEVKLNEQVIAQAVNKSLVKVMSGKR